VFTNRFTWVAASPIVPGPIRISMRRSALSRGSNSGAYRNPSRRNAGHWIAIWPRPPASAAIAIAMIGGKPSAGIIGTRTNAPTIVATLNIAGASAGTK
jgi:hypothetical protein